MCRMPSITTVNRHALGRSFTLKRLAVICTFNSTITSFQIALELKGNGKVCPHSGDQKLDPEACLVWREGHHIGPINGLKKIITLWLKTWRYIRRKSTRTSKNAVKGAQLPKKEREKEKNPSHTNSQQNHFLQIHTLFQIQNQHTPQGHFSQAHTWPLRFPAVSSWWRQLKKALHWFGVWSWREGEGEVEWWRGCIGALQ